VATAYDQRVAEAMRKASNAVAAGATIKGATPAMPNAKPVVGVASGVAAAATPKTTGVVPPASVVKPQATPAVAQPSQPVVPGIPNMRGGVDYGTATGAQKQELVGQRQRELNDSDYRQSEINRTLGVIEGLKADGKDYSAQEKYLTKNLGYVPPMPQVQQAVPPTPQPTTMATDAVYTPRTSQELQQSSGDSLAIERAALQNAVRTQIQSLKNAAQYSNQLIQDERALQDQSFARNNNPFSGRTAYDKSTVLRGRGIDDSARAAQITNQIQSYETELANFDKLAPERQRQIYNELLEMERNFGLNVGQLTGNFGGQRTLQGQSFDWQRNMDVADRTGNLNGQRTLQGQSFDRGIYEDDRNFKYQTGRDQVSDNQWNQQFSFQKVQQEWENNFRQGQFDWEKAQSLWENTFKEKNFQQQVKEHASSQGLQWASLSQRQKEFVADEAWRSKQYDLEVQKMVETEKPQSAEEYSKYIDSAPYFGKDEEGLPIITNVTAVEKMILQAPISDAEKMKLYARYGIPTD
jgi:hypothetical protein